jgi:hypothetical protein
MKENLAGLPPTDNVRRVTIPTLGWSIENQPGKKASVAIYSYMATAHSGLLNPVSAQCGLELYGEYVEEARQHPGSHPNIDLLLDVVSNGATATIVVETIPT